MERDSALERLLLGDLLDLLDDPEGPEMHRWLLAVLDALERILPREFASEEAGGYMQEVLDEYPSWERQVLDLRQQHRLLYKRLRELRREVAHTRPQRIIAMQCRVSLYEWVDQVRDHNGRETALLQTAINLEVGVGD
jgi:hypothetical protein